MSDEQTAPGAAQDAGPDTDRQAQDAEQVTEAPGTRETPVETTVEAASAAAADPAARKVELEAELEKLRGEAAEARDQMLRTLADMDNLRKRTARDLESAHKYALEKFALELLPVRDSLELGLDAASGEAADIAKLREGTELTLRMLTTALEKHGIAEVAPQGEKFDPDLHQAMATQPSSEVAPDHVMTVYQKGYTLNERLLRPALVIVAAEPPPADAGGA
jgi:molecular chaperone GrpE